MCRKATEPSNQGEEISLSQEPLGPLSLVAHAFVGCKYILRRDTEGHPASDGFF